MTPDNGEEMPEGTEQSEANAQGGEGEEVTGAEEAEQADHLGDEGAGPVVDGEPDGESQ